MSSLVRMMHWGAYEISSRLFIRQIRKSEQQQNWTGQKDRRVTSAWMVYEVCKSV